MDALFTQWKAANRPRLQSIAIGCHPKQLIETLSEDLLQIFADASLIDRYDMYQHLMSYWADTMQDDVYMIAVDGWVGASKLRLIIEDKEKKNKEKADFIIGKRKYKADLIPPVLVILRYFLEEQAAIEEMEAHIETLERAIEEMKEEHGGEEGLLEDFKDEKGSINKGAIVARLREIVHDPDTAEEWELLTRYLDLIEQEYTANKQLKEAQKALESKVVAKYGKLTEDEIKTLVVDDKWLATLSADVQSELDRVSQALTGRIKQLAERYAMPLPKLTEEVETLGAKVDEHLDKMGFMW